MSENAIDAFDNSPLPPPPTQDVQETSINANVEVAHTGSNAPRALASGYVSVQRLDRLVTDNDGRVLDIKRPHNRALVAFNKSVSLSGEVPSSVKISGDYGNNDHVPCLWEEGGAIPSGQVNALGELSPQQGVALTIASPRGERLTARHVRDVSNVVNGRRALFNVGESYYIALSCYHKDGDVARVVGIYRVSSIEFGEKNPCFICSLECAFVDGAPYSFDDGDIPETRFTPDHPFVRAAELGCTKVYNGAPTYINPYVSSYFEKDDYSDILADEAFYQSRVVVSSLQEAYAQADAKLAEIYRVENLGAKENRQAKKLVLTTSICYYAEQQKVVVFLMGTVYDRATKSSKEGRKCYYQVVLTPGQPFRYLDGDVDIEYDEVVRLLKAAPNQCMVISIERNCSTPLY